MLQLAGKASHARLGTCNIPHSQSTSSSQCRTPSLYVLRCDAFDQCILHHVSYAPLDDDAGKAAVAFLLHASEEGPPILQEAPCCQQIDSIQSACEERNMF